MIRSNRSYKSLLNALLLGGLLGFGAIAQAQAHPPAPESHRIQVQAQAEISVAPDMATLDARLWESTPAIARSEDAQSDPQALAEARERLEARTGELIRTLEKAGLDSAAITAGSLMVHPDYVQQPASGDEPGETLVRTQIERPISLRIDDLNQVPVILDALTRAGVNALDGITYDLEDRSAATDKALTRALEKARHKAELMASTLGVGLGQVIGIQETNAMPYAPQMMAMRADAMESKAAPQYRPGEITIESGVSVAWGIKP